MNRKKRSKISASQAINSTRLEPSRREFLVGVEHGGTGRPFWLERVFAGT